MSLSEFVGVDWCRSGWFSVGFSSDGEYELEVFAAFADLLTHYKAAKLILVDIPIGLPEGAEERPGDIEAKGLLAGYRDWSVFRAPTRAATEHLANHPRDRKGAKEVQLRITGEPLSDQTLGIMRQIFDVDSVLLARSTNAAPQVREVHPEILFWALNDTTSMRYPKYQSRGIRERIGVLNRVYPQTREIVEASWPMIVEKYFVEDGLDVDVDDVLDALAAAVTADRISLDPSQTRTLPANPPKDANGLPMEMVYWIP